MANAKTTKKTKTKSAKPKSCNKKCTIPKYEYVVLTTDKKPEWYLLFGIRKIKFAYNLNQKSADEKEIYPIAYINTNTYISLIDALDMATRGRVKTEKEMRTYLERRGIITLNLVDVKSHKIPMNLMRCER